MWTPNTSDIVTAETKANNERASLIDKFKLAIQGHVDATAASRNYTDGVSLASYVASTVPSWASEAAAFVAWRDAVWSYAYAELDKVLSGSRPQPSIDELLNELPEINWPEQEETNGQG